MVENKQWRTWAEVDLDALAHNYRVLRGMIPENCRFLGLVKADAYGHGAVPIARKLQKLGADMLAVATVDEGKELRRGGIELPILCLGQTPPWLAEELLTWDITQTVEDLETGFVLSRAAQSAGKTLKIHVKLDTGMGRLGFLWQEGQDNTELLDDIQTLCALPGLKAEGLFTHFSDADGSEEYTIAQLKKFLDARNALKERGVSFQICHCSASSAVLQYPCAYLDMIRPGIALYGYCPAPELEGLDGAELRPVMTVKSRIAAVRSLPKGSCVSYGRTAVLKRDSRLAVVPIGYGDGYPRQLSNGMSMEIHGTWCPVVGRICMDMCMVDVTDLPAAKAGDVALVYGPGLTQKAAQQCGTIVYELLCGLTARVSRIYLGDETD